MFANLCLPNLCLQTYVWLGLALKTQIQYSNFSDVLVTKKGGIRMKEQEFVKKRKAEIKMREGKTIGECVSNVKYDVMKMAQFMDCVKSVYNKTKRIMFDGRLRSSSGNIEFGSSGFESIKINPKLPATDKGIDEYFDTIKHELVHGITRADDCEQEFIACCKKNNIGLSHNIDEIGENYNYQIICNDCGRGLNKYKRMTGRAKKIDDGNKNNRYHCVCGSYNLKVNKYKKEE